MKTNFLDRRLILLAFLTALVAFTPRDAHAQNIVGDWQGTLKAGPAELRLVLHIAKSADGSLKATLDSVDQPGANGIPVTSISLTGGELTFAVDSVHGSYEGKVSSDATTLSGMWTQGSPLPLEFKKTATPLKTEHKPAKPSDIDGDWMGTLDTGGMNLRVAFHITNTADGLTATMDSIDQGARGIPVTKVTRNESSLKMELKAIGGTFEGKIDKALTTIEGTWTQGGGSLPLVLKRGKSVTEEPFKPADYVREDAFHERDVTVGQGKWKLPGTLSFPVGKGPFPAVVLVHGSGPEDRDESVGAEKPFRDLAGGLASRQIAVLRYEKRSKQYPAEFAALGSEITVNEETIDDAIAAVALLRGTPGIDPRRIYVLGHSLGGSVAPRIAKLDSGIAGLVVLAGGNLPLDDTIIRQLNYLASLTPTMSPEQQKHLDDMKAAVAKVKLLTSADANSETFIFGAPPRYWLDLRDYVPAETAKELSCRMLILQGARDYQVTVEDYQVWQTTLAGRPNVTAKLYPELNHLFIAGEGKSTPAEYMQPNHVSEEVVKDIAKWIAL